TGGFAWLFAEKQLSSVRRRIDVLRLHLTGKYSADAVRVLLSYYLVWRHVPEYRRGGNTGKPVQRQPAGDLLRPDFQGL
ncbi:hypothetical protein NL533_29565, partial [Klebsiella pneumoniae]|nr:hypothetical protein [Klebsiella pneumoniae]